MSRPEKKIDLDNLYSPSQPDTGRPKQPEFEPPFQRFTQIIRIPNRPFWLDLRFFALGNKTLKFAFLEPTFIFIELNSMEYDQDCAYLSFSAKFSGRY